MLNLLARLPPQMPDATPTEDLPPSLVVNGRIYLASSGPHPISVTRDPLKTEFNVTLRQTAGGRVWFSGSRLPKAVTMKVTFSVIGTDADEVGARAARWHYLSLQASEYGEGASAVMIRVVLSHTEPYGEGNTRTWSVEYLLYDQLWRLDGTDPRPAPLPTTGELGNYPLGMLHAVAEGPGYYEVDPLGGVTITDAPAVTYTMPDGTTFTYSHLIEVVDDES